MPSVGQYAQDAFTAKTAKYGSPVTVAGVAGVNCFVDESEHEGGKLVPLGQRSAGGAWAIIFFAAAMAASIKGGTEIVTSSGKKYVAKGVHPKELQGVTVYIAVAAQRL